MKKLFSIVLFFLLGAIGLPQATLAIGQLTQPIVISDILRGEELIETLSLFNSKAEPDDYGLEGKGDVEDWLSFYEVDDVNFENPITQVNVPAKSYQDVKMKINVPSDIPNGEYVGQAIVHSMPTDNGSTTGTTTMTVRQKIGREIFITITDEEIIDLQAAVIPEFYDIDEGQQLNINIEYNNKGNILLKPSVGLKIISTIDNSTVFDAVFAYPVDQEPIAAKTTKTIPIKWQSAGQPKARYEARLKIIVDEDVVQEEDFRFNLGLSEDKTLSLVAKLGNGSLALGWVIIGIVLLIIAAILIVIRRKKIKNY